MLLPNAIRLTALLGALTLSACTVAVDGPPGTPSPTNGNGNDTSSGTSDPASPGQTPSAENPGPAATDYDALFEAPTNPETTPDSIFGVWAGTENQGSSYDVRIRVQASSITVATRRMDAVGRTTNGVSVAALVTKSSIKVLASKSSQSSSFETISFVPTSVPVCGGTTSSQANCAGIYGTELSLYATDLFTIGGYAASGGYTKLSD